MSNGVTALQWLSLSCSLYTKDSAIKELGVADGSKPQVSLNWNFPPTILEQTAEVNLYMNMQYHRKEIINLCYKS